MSIKLWLTLALTLGCAGAAAQPANWRRYAVPESGASVDIPLSVFTEDGGKPEAGYGGRFLTPDHRANLTVESVPSEGLSPARFLAKRHPPSNIVYQRVTGRFFVVSSFRNDKIWYNRCNFSGRLVHCVLINYPADEERDWDKIVTRISLLLSGS